ncbi:MAG: phosphotransferase [Ardenticatenaceae bacterium]|nr:phosphotransferase [Anaerolineales bacterium]MCB8921851.1 phosphotransferase [Ardenticatenaceae bacterium]MCB8990991.1 phosphotransferase [Ardenticatenaceae bacterium]MCB9005329.1 phosphotransferase [Ardenticatenaceae bacterium]
MFPSAFVRITLELHGRTGQTWLDNLPNFLAEYAQRWRLTLLPPFPNLTYNYVAPAVREDGTAVVLKVGIINPELQSEIAALDHYAGRGAVRLLQADAENGIFLLQRVQPGHSLVPLQQTDDDAATRIAAEVMRQLWRPAPPAPYSFPTVAHWAAGLGRLRERFDGRTGPFDAQLIETAESLFADLLASSAEPVLLHGDLHHDNILAAGDGWLAIDPKGVIGEPAYEVGALLRNFWRGGETTAEIRRMLARRIAIFSEMLGFDRQRLAAWGAAQAVLSAWWSYEDHGHGWEWGTAVAEALLPQIES